MVEALLGVAVVSCAGLVLPGHWGLLTLTPHPFWIVVLAIAFRYGRLSGYGVGILAALSFSLFAWLRPGAQLQALPTPDAVQAALLFVGGALIGELAHAQRQRTARIEEQLRHTTVSLWHMTDRCQDLQEVNDEFKKRIVGQTASVTTLYTIARQMGTLNRDELYIGIVALVAQFLESQACALYLMRDGGCRLVTGIPDAQPQRPAILDLRHPLFSQAIRQRGVVTIRDEIMQHGPASVAGGPALMAGPLLNPAGTVCGMVVVEQLSFLKLTPANVQVFGLILDWASRALHNAALFEQAYDGRLLERAVIDMPPALCSPLGVSAVERGHAARLGGAAYEAPDASASPFAASAS
jgi:hypothetical protein